MTIEPIAKPDHEPGGYRGESPVPEPTIALDLRSLDAKVWLDEDEDTSTLSVRMWSEGVVVAFEPGAGRDTGEAIRRAERAADALLAWAQLMRVRRGDRWLPRLTSGARDLDRATP